MRDLHVGRSTVWPALIASQAVGVLGMRGAGKSNLGRVVAEELFASRIPFVVFDPIGNWYGIRAGRDGRPGGGIPVPIFGGQHGDLQLDRNSGQKIADLVIERRLSCVLDLSHADLSETDKRKFLVDFGERLFRRKERESGWLTLIMEEADDYAPQNVHGGEREGSTARTLGMFQRLVKRGRFKGLGALLITQRSAAINKDLLYMVGTLIAFRTTGPRDQEAVGGWVKHNAIGEKVLESLATLEDGEAWVIAPEALGTIARAHFRRMATYDTGATPEHGGQAKPATLADIDVPALTKELHEAIEKAKAEDPRELRKTIADLRAQLAKAETFREPASAPAKAPRVVEKPVLKDALVKRLETALGRFEKVFTVLADRDGQVWAIAAEIRAALAAARDAHSALPASTGAPAGRPVGSAGIAGGGGRAGSLSAPGSSRPAPVVPRREASAHGLTGPEQKILDELAGLEAIGITPAPRLQLAMLCGYGNPRSGGFTGPLGRLSVAGLITYPNPGAVALTTAGAEKARADETPLTNEALHRRIFEMLPGPRAKILNELIAAYPKALERTALAERLGYGNPRSGGFTGPLGTLSKLGMIRYPSPGTVVATQLLFPQAS